MLPHQAPGSLDDVEIHISLAQIEPPVGDVRVLTIADSQRSPPEVMHFVGWLGLLSALSEVTRRSQSAHEC